MSYSSIINAEELVVNLGDPDWVVMDCRFSLLDPDMGRKDYTHGHIPDALYAHLDEDLCSKVVKGKTGRHPLPTLEVFVSKLNSWGIDHSSQVVVYDDAGGSMAAARFWWLMQWVGHERTAVLNGGWSNWVRKGFPVRGGTESRTSRHFIPKMNLQLMVDARELYSTSTGQKFQIIDVRAPERYSGETEPIDPIAGHIPGAINFPYTENLDNQGFFISPGDLRSKYEKLLGNESAASTVFYCGSGVTAAQSLLALSYARMGIGRLYPGSWSEWITDPEHPIEIG